MSETNKRIDKNVFPILSKRILTGNQVGAYAYNPKGIGTEFTVGKESVLLRAYQHGSVRKIDGVGITREQSYIYHTRDSELKDIITIVPNKNKDIRSVYIDTEYRKKARKNSISIWLKEDSEFVIRILERVNESFIPPHESKSYFHLVYDVNTGKYKFKYLYGDKGSQEYSTEELTEDELKGFGLVNLSLSFSREVGEEDGLRVQIKDQALMIGISNNINSLVNNLRQGEFMVGGKIISISDTL